MIRARDPPDGSMIHVSGHERHAEVVAELVLGVVHDRPVPPPRSAKKSSTWIAVLADDRVELGAVVAERLLLVHELDQLGMLADARHAVVGEEVEHHPAALAPRRLERGPVGEHAGGVGATLPISGEAADSALSAVSSTTNSANSTIATPPRSYGATRPVRRVSASSGARRRVMPRQPTGTSSCSTSGTGADTGSIGGGGDRQESGEQRAGRHHQPADPEPDDERLEEHLEMNLARRPTSGGRLPAIVR